jgi:hypothetical protein
VNFHAEARSKQRRKKSAKKEHNNKASNAKVLPPAGGEDLGGVKNISHGLARIFFV